MEILTKTDRVFESSNVCPGCGSILGLKMLLQSIDDLKNVILVVSPGEIASMARYLRVNVVNSRDPVSTARGIAASKPEARVIVYSGDVYTAANLPSILDARENILYVCYNNTCYVDGGRLKTRDFARSLIGKASYAATASVAYYEDFVAKLKKSLAMNGFKFIDLLAPCPSLWKYDPSNTVELGRMATEALLWPLYEAENRVMLTKIPPQTETVERYVNGLKSVLSQNELVAAQEKASRSWKAINEGKLL